ncbi:hypothetical protein SATMO3_44630 [Sporomusa aerivorans]
MTRKKSIFNFSTRVQVLREHLKLRVNGTNIQKQMAVSAACTDVTRQGTKKQEAWKWALTVYILKR